MNLNWKEDRVIRAIASGKTTIRDVARKCFPGVRPVEKADSQVRNNVRRLVRDGLVQRAKRKAEALRAYGAYEVTAEGAEFVESTQPIPAPKNPPPPAVKRKITEPIQVADTIPGEVAQ